MKRRASDERSRPVSRQQRRHRKGRTGRLSCFLAVLACGLVCYLVSVLHLFRAHDPVPRRYVGNGAGTAAKMLSHAYDDEPKPKPSIIRPQQPKQPQPPKDACAAHRWRNDTDLKGGDLKGGMRAAGGPAAFGGPLDVIRKTVAAEGPLGVYKGVTANYLRFGPYCVLVFIFVEQLRAVEARGSTRC